jgi:hypothetical protein
LRYVEVPHKAESAEVWLQQETPALANAEPASDKVTRTYAGNTRAIGAAAGADPTRHRSAEGPFTRAAAAVDWITGHAPRGFSLPLGAPWFLVPVSWRFQDH